MKIGSIKLDRPIDQVLKARIEPYAIEVGILQDAPHKKAARGKPLSNYAGGSVRKVQRGKTDGTMTSVSRDVRFTTGINYLVEPWKKKNSDAMKLLRGFFNLAFGESKLRHKKRVENLAQAIVRNPILQRKYGSNSRLTRKIKGFNRKFIDTGQLFKAIKARVRINLGKKK